MHIVNAVLGVLKCRLTFAGLASRASLHVQIVDLSKLGPQVGQRAPDFTLTDQTGKTWTLQSIMGAKGAMLVFFRSADW